MKRLWILSIFCILFLTSCSTKKVETPSYTAVPNLEFSSSIKLFIEQAQKITTLSHADINLICAKLQTYVSDCKDGSQILTLEFNRENTIYIHYTPKRLSNGSYQFFQTLHPSYDISYKEDGSVVIPIHINNSKDALFEANVDYSMIKDNLEINKISFTFFNEEAKEFNEMYASLDSTSQKDYCLSLIPNKNGNSKELTEFLRACIYNGNMYVLEELYKLTHDNDSENKFKIELANAMASVSSISLSASNPYQPELFYSENYQDFPQINTLSIIVTHLQTSKSLEELGAKEIEPNFDWESVYQIPNIHNFYKFIQENEPTTGVYKFDMDQDGLMEILILFPGGTMGNLFWEILHLDKSGYITETNSGGGMEPLSLYHLHGKYFFLTRIMDSYDKETLGWEIYALNRNGKMYQASIWYEKIGSEIIFTDNYMQKTEKKDWNSHSWGLYDRDFDNYIDLYKRYEHNAIGQKIQPNKKVLMLFGDSDESTSYNIYGSFDFNNDNIDDWTKVYMFFPSNRNPYYCNYTFVDGKTNQLLDFSNIITEYNSRLCCVIPYEFENRNYFLCILNGYGNYIFKLIEIKGMEPIELQNWLVSITKRILIQVSESNDIRNSLLY